MLEDGAARVTSPPRAVPIAADLYCDILSEPPRKWREVFPGVLVALLGTLAAGFLTDRYGAPLTLMALLIGLSLNFISADARMRPGLEFSSRGLLRCGIVLIGVRVTFGEMLSLGPYSLLSVVLIVALAIGLGIFFARWAMQDSAFGVLAGGAVAICGASAALAIAGVLGTRRASQEKLTLVLVGISLMSAAAMLLYPILAHFMALSDRQAGFLFGASIHDVAQALGAGFAYSDAAGHVAAIVKLTRVALLAPVLLVVALFLPGRSETAIVPVPWFVTGFFLLAGINSTGIIPMWTTRLAESLASGVLAVAVTAVAMLSPMNRVLGAGWKPLLVIFGATLCALALSLGAAIFLVAP